MVTSQGMDLDGLYKSGGVIYEEVKKHSPGGNKLVWSAHVAQEALKAMDRLCEARAGSPAKTDQQLTFSEKSDFDTSEYEECQEEDDSTPGKDSSGASEIGVNEDVDEHFTVTQRDHFRELEEEDGEELKEKDTDEEKTKSFDEWWSDDDDGNFGNDNPIADDYQKIIEDECDTTFSTTNARY